MKTILEYRLDANGEACTLRLTEGFRIVRTEYIPFGRTVFMWVEVPLKAGTPELPVEFRVVASGQPVSDDFEYAGTALDSHDPQAYHVFRRPAGNRTRQAPDTDQDATKLVRVA